MNNEFKTIANELFELAEDPAISSHMSTVLFKLANRLSESAVDNEKPVAWLWECINGPYAGEIDVYSVTTPIDRKEVERVKGLYSEPFPVYK